MNFSQVFRPEITLGTIIEICVFIMAVAGGIRKFGQLEAKLNIMYTWFETVVLRHGGESGAGRGDVQSAKDFFKSS